MHSIFFQITQFQKIEASDPYNLVQVSPLTGEVIANRVLDYEIGDMIVFQVNSFHTSLFMNVVHQFGKANCKQ